MASRKRALLEPTDDWQQLQFHLDWTEQTRYELIRPVVVFGAPPVERAKQTGVSARTIYRKVNRFDELGMQSPFEGDLSKNPKVVARFGMGLAYTLAKSPGLYSAPQGGNPPGARLHARLLRAFS